ncbi:MAG: hypothetical protein ACLP0J_25970 [Solirubrobacteraceae bacterium]
MSLRRGRLIAAGLGVVLLLSLSLEGCGSSAAKSTSATSSSSAVNVVPVTGTVAGNGYSYWLQRSIQLLFSSPAPLSTCDTLTSNGQRVGFFTFSTTPGTYHAMCSEPAGRPLYVEEAWNECSTFEGDHSKGTSDQQLMLCARNMSEIGGQEAKLGWKGVTMSATVDGKLVNLWKLLAATGVYPVQAAVGNTLGAFSGSGRSAAYGLGLLLAGFAKGTHVIHSVFTTIGVGHWDNTVTVHVH